MKNNRERAPLTARVLRLTLAILTIIPVCGARAELPSVKMLTAPLVTPQNAVTYYNGLPTTATTGVAAPSGTAPEIQELSRALGAGRYSATAYATTVYEYVRNNIGIEFRFGLSKGGRGALIDQSGTPFDQAHLMVSLLSQGGVTASFNVGTLSLTGTQFTAWSGISDAKAACQYLADGGIPATVNASSSCSSLTSGTSVSAVTMLHPWVVANSTIYDPSYKVQIKRTGIDLATALGCAGSPNPTCASSLLSTTLVPAITTCLPGISCVQNVNRTGIEAQLNAYATNLQHYLQNYDISNNTYLAIEDAIGGLIVDISQPTSAGSLLPSSAYGAASYTWNNNGIPDAFRTSMTVQVDQINQLLFADEIAGQRIRMWGYADVSTASTTTEHFTLYAEYKALVRSDQAGASGGETTLNLIIHHPYAANSGTYASETIGVPIVIMLNECASASPSPCDSSAWHTGVITIMQGFGEQGPSHATYYADLQRRDKINGVIWANPSDPKNIYPGMTGGGPKAPPHVCTTLPSPTTPSDQNTCFQQQEATFIATWLAQTSRSRWMAGTINAVALHNHHSVGAALASDFLTGTETILSAQTTLSADSLSNSSTDRTAAFMGIAAAMNRLEGGIFEQANGALDGGAGISMMTRANDSHFPFLDVTASNVATVTSALANNSWVSSSISAVTSYATASPGYELIVPLNGNAGSVAMTNGTAYFYGTGLAAFGSNNDRIAYLATLPPFYVKGSGGAVAYDPANEAEQSVKVHDYSVAHRKSYSVNLVNGLLQLHPAPDLVTGNGAFPLSLSFQRVFDSSAIGDTTFIDSAYVPQSHPTQTDPTDLGFGWTHTLAISAAVQSDAFVGMGQDSALDASQMITGMFVQRWLNLGAVDMRSRLAGVFATHWMINSLNRNVVVVARPPKRTTFVKLPDGKFDPGAGNYEVLTQNGIQTLDGFNGDWVWNAIGMSFTLVDRDGSSMNLVQSLPSGGFSGLAPWIYPYNYIFVPGIWSFPTGVKLTFSYGTTGVNVANQQACLINVTSNLGRSLTFSDPCDGTYVRTVTDDAGRKISLGLSFSSFGGQVQGADGGITQYDYTVPSGLVTNRAAAGIFRVFTPNDQSTPAYTISYDSLFRVKTLTDNSQPTQFSSNYFVSGLYGTQNQSRGESVDALGAVTTQYFDKHASLLQSIDTLGDVTSYTYDAHRRMVSHIYPELNSESYSYDVRHNQLTQVRHPKPGSTLGITPTETTTYVEGPSVSTCAYPASCNKVASIQDARLNTTTYSYLGQNTTSGSGQLQRTLSPSITPQSGGASGQAQTDYCYSSITASGQTGAISLPVASVQKVDASAKRVSSYSYNASKLVLQSATQDPTTTYVAPGTAGGACTTTAKSGALALVTNFTFDSVGNVKTIDGPIAGSADTTTYAFDSMRRLTWVAAPLSQLTRYCYDIEGELLSTNRVRPLSATSTAPATSTDLNAATETTDGSCPTSYPSAQWLIETRTYFPTGDLKTVADALSQTTSYVYDPMGRPQVVQDPDGRQTATVYDLSGEVIGLWRGGSGWINGTVPSATAPTASTVWNPSGYAGTGPFQYEGFCHNSKCYTPNGKPLYAIDAGNIITAYEYDGLDRLQFTYFVDPAVGASRCTQAVNDGATPTCTGQATYEKYSYDASDNKTSLRTRKGDVIGYHYDQMGRQDSRTPAGQGIVTTGIDFVGEPVLVSKAANGSFPAHSTAYTYDAAGRKLTETNDGLTVTESYDTLSAANDDGGNLTRITWPDGYYVTYAHDFANRMSDVRENSTTTNELAHYTYDVLSSRQQACLAGQGSTCNATNQIGYGYEATGQLNALTHTMNGTTVSFGFGRNHSYQITTISANDAFYLPTPASAASIPYVPNALNEYGTIGGQTSTYDLNGNLLTWFPSSGKSTYTYDSENRLTTAATNGSTTPTVFYDYDALGRRVSKTVGGTGIGVGGATTRYLPDGVEDIAEYNGATLLRRYVTGSGTDDRIAHVEGSAITNPAKTYYHTNHQGSVIAVTDGVGNVSQRVGYDEYGNGSQATGEPFGYTGRRYDPETGLYYYRARYYAPQIGRFLQTDPVGYKDDLNVYAYVGNDPTNKTDPGGLAGCGSLDKQNCDSARTAQEVAIKDIKSARAAIQQLRDERAAVASGKQDSLSDAAKKTESLVNSYFKSSDNKTLGRIDSVLGNTQGVLEDDGSRYNFKLGKSDVRGNMETLGYANPFSSKITLTPEFFGVSQRIQVETLIHEPSHIQGINVFPFQRETYDNDVLKLSGPRALNNADSYAQFVPH